MKVWSSMAACGAALGIAASTLAQAPVTTTLYVSGLSRPVDMVQHPTNPNVQFVVQQSGTIRVIENGALGGTFLNVTSLIVDSTSERGLLGLAFDPAYGTEGGSDCSDCFYVYHTAGSAGATNVARYRHVAGNDLLADTNTRELLFSVAQPFSNHNGGHLEMGPDGMLYIALGDGGLANDPQENAQNINSLLGKILRIDVSQRPGFTNPPDNPFVGVDGNDMIWSWGLRNPWQFSFDTGPCATNAMLIGDVGQDAREEINYEPAGAGGRNYGWDCMEGNLCWTNDVGCSCDDDLTDPIHVVNQPIAQSITGGYVYRGASMPANRGRYIFGDFLTGRSWSLGLAIDQNGEAMVTDVVEISQQIGQFNISGFAHDAAGELYVINYSGQIRKIQGVHAPADLDLNGSVNGADLANLLSNWFDAGCGAADLNNDGIVNGADLATLLSQWG